MAPPILSSGQDHSTRSVSDDCSGWSCLSDAAQFGIVLVVIFFVFAVAYIYWRLWIKPQRQSSNAQPGEETTSARWEVSRRSPRSITITIYREARSRDDQNDDEGEDNADGSRMRRRRRGKNNTNADDGEDDKNKTLATTTENMPGPAVQVQPSQIITSSPAPVAYQVQFPDVHVIPPPPPAVIYAAAPQTLFPPPPSFSPTIVAEPVVPPPPPPPVVVEPSGVNQDAAPQPPSTVQPPCAAQQPYVVQPDPSGITNSPTVYPQAPGPNQAIAMPTAPPTQNPQEVNMPAYHQPSTNPVAEPVPQAPRRRWFSLRSLIPRTGYAQTISDSGTAPGSPRVPPTTPNRGTGHERRASSRRGRDPTADRHESRHGRRCSRSESPGNRLWAGIASSDISMQAIQGSALGVPDRAERSPTPAQRQRYHRTSSASSVRPGHYDQVPLSPKAENHRSQSPDSSREEVEFAHPRDSDDMFTCSASEKASHRSYHRRYSEMEYHEDEEALRSQGRRQRQGGLTGLFRRMRRALRGGY